ncbi:MAG: fibronectin type III domain-containing protein [candidate division WOR-3 bacterium]
MKKTPTFLLVFLVMLFFFACEQKPGGSPRNFAIQAATDTTLKLTWEAPTEGTPTKYYIYFKALGEANYTKVDEVSGTTTSYIHNPQGNTGYYYVSAVFGKNEYESDEKNTVPVPNPVQTLSELNAAGNSGYGWNRQTGSANTYSMTQAANASNVDFYITNFAFGYNRTPYNIASPDMAPSDSGNVTPPGSWRVNGISDPITDPQAPLPRYIEGTTYFNYTEIDRDPLYVAVKTEDNYYALVKISGVNTQNGTVQIESWFQKIQGLRLIKH